MIPEGQQPSLVPLPHHVTYFKVPKLQASPDVAALHYLSLSAGRGGGVARVTNGLER